MKKSVSILLTLVLLAFMAACGKPAAPTESNPVSSEVSVPEASTTTEADPAGTTAASEATTTKKTPTTVKATTTAKASTTKTVTSTTKAAEKVKINVTAIAGPTGVGMAQLMAQNDAKKTANEYKFNVVTDPSQAVAAISSGTADIAAVPTNLASTLYKKTGGKVQVLAVNTLGVLYMLDSTGTVQSVQELRGKTIYTSGQGANPEYVLRYVLKENGLDPDKDVTLQFVADNDALTGAVVSGQAQVAMVPEQKVTACLTQMKAAGKTPPAVALDMTEEWNRVADGKSALMMGCVVARKAFVEKNPAAVRAFLAEYKTSIQTVNSDVDTAAGWCEKYDIIPKAAMAKQAIPRCNLTFETGAAMKNRLSGYLQVLYDYNPASVGGAVPPADFYYAG